MRVRSIGLALLVTVTAAAAALVAVAPAAAARAPAGYLMSQYWFASGHRFVAVQTGKEGHGLHVLPQTARRYAAWSLAYSCDNVDGRPVRGVGGGTAPMRPVQPLLPVGRGVDYCHVSVFTYRRTRHYAEHRIWEIHKRRQAVAITPAGRTFILRVRGTSQLSNAMSVAQQGYVAATRTYPPATQLASKDNGVVALSAATDVPPPGRAGLWTDGAHHMRATYVMADGTVLFYDRDTATRLTATNAQDELDELHDTELDLDSPWYDVDANVEAGRG